MKYLLSSITILSFAISSCQTGKIKVISDMDHDLKEVSGIETITNSSLLWVIEDAGNTAKILGVNNKGSVDKSITLESIKNNDWEDLASDNRGNLYIGDFGNNSRKRKNFTILKITSIDSAKNREVLKVNFTLPKGLKSKDFEAFFLLKNNFYIFSKEKKKAVVIKVPNRAGNHEAVFVSKFSLKGKETEVTSADISENGKTIVLLNHDRIWKLTNFEDESFFGGTIEELKLGHKSQKEGVCFINDSVLYITDERKKSEGGNIYSFELD
ncbi:hypothetical protein C7447_103334 [Tenacibaculum adriaticum]|uniref:SdiA-regulated protein n=1 Tax=Tenacibaculum adriaticum TaxID=413713 RepID=A0A5S5DR53_9FLAO|nr:hypothetical protein [Tenacibaculum adriaticum]TYP98164.1 hypothetical protein C7447_103334 [Tenacibaculum adriaticum]